MMLSMLRALPASRSFACLCFLSVLTGAIAQTTPVPVSPFDGEPFSESADALKSASAAMPPTKEFGAEILYQEGIYRIALDGTLHSSPRI
jgi:hypothetical protein